MGEHSPSIFWYLFIFIYKRACLRWTCRTHKTAKRAKGSTWNRAALLWQASLRLEPDTCPSTDTWRPRKGTFTIVRLSVEENQNGKGDSFNITKWDISFPQISNVPPPAYVLTTIERNTFLGSGLTFEQKLPIFPYIRATLDFHPQIIQIGDFCRPRVGFNDFWRPAAHKIQAYLMLQMWHE